MRRDTGGATELARQLEQYPAAPEIRCSNLDGVRQLEIAGAGADEVRHVETSLRVITKARSLGVDSMLEARGRWQPNGVAAGLPRLTSCLEPLDELSPDLEQVPG